MRVNESQRSGPVPKLLLVVGGICSSVVLRGGDEHVIGGAQVNGEQTAWEKKPDDQRLCGGTTASAARDAAVTEAAEFLAGVIEIKCNKQTFEKVSTKEYEAIFRMLAKAACDRAKTVQWSIRNIRQRTGEGVVEPIPEYYQPVATGWCRWPCAWLAGELCDHLDRERVRQLLETCAEDLISRPEGVTDQWYLANVLQICSHVGDLQNWFLTTGVNIDGNLKCTDKLYASALASSFTKLPTAATSRDRSVICSISKVLSWLVNARAVEQTTTADEMTVDSSVVDLTAHLCNLWGHYRFWTITRLAWILAPADVPRNISNRSFFACLLASLARNRPRVLGKFCANVGFPRISLENQRQEKIQDEGTDFFGRLPRATLLTGQPSSSHQVLNSSHDSIQRRPLPSHPGVVLRPEPRRAVKRCRWPLQPPHSVKETPPAVFEGSLPGAFKPIDRQPRTTFHESSIKPGSPEFNRLQESSNDGQDQSSNDGQDQSSNDGQDQSWNDRQEESSNDGQHAVPSLSQLSLS
ncbi:hypothetical protein GNI_005990 [Gregarina niphandrodes]|uniref:Uncharacterized protein n=1 Tax=Gregarina niphandrodes TaxID=110365 RepID=A0A023BD77_GRENI|nr:hypothetical protein GNI_005990 [Gregarina niphandrodes]EZG87980.1 hypothetical protein GNI_005990 [Gregarina niphandrodes]|eukprot:XP_011128630.1 hypothetical protein GNI_005990 [Gregarina niphandrodes]